MIEMFNMTKCKLFTNTYRIPFTGTVNKENIQQIKFSIQNIFYVIYIIAVMKNEVKRFHTNTEIN